MLVRSVLQTVKATAKNLKQQQLAADEQKKQQKTNKKLCFFRSNVTVILVGSDLCMTLLLTFGVVKSHQSMQPKMTG